MRLNRQNLSDNMVSSQDINEDLAGNCGVFCVEGKRGERMAQDYYRARLALNPADPSEQKCIEYLSGFGEQRMSALKDLLLLGLDVKTGVKPLLNEEIREQIISMENQINDLKKSLDSQNRAVEEQRKEIEKRDCRLLQLKQVIKEMNSEQEDSFTYDKVVANVIHRESNEDGSKPTTIVKYETKKR